jgi:hypothetical protein
MKLKKLKGQHVDFRWKDNWCWDFRKVIVRDDAKE